METKRLKNFRLSPQAVRALLDLAHRLGISQTAVLELAIRELARRHRESS